MKQHWIVLAGLSSLAVLAQPAPQDEALRLRISEARAQLQTERLAIEQAHTQQTQACWQRFAVNDCLSQVRRSRRTALEPIRAQELALNAQERAVRTRERDARLQQKSAGGAHD